MKILIILVLSLLTSGCAEMVRVLSLPDANTREGLHARYPKVFEERPREKWVPPVGVDSYCSPMTSAGMHCVSNVGGHSTRCNTYADGSMVCNTSP